MKITKARLKELIREQLQKEGSYGNEGSMADSQLNRISDLAMMIDEMVSDETNLPEWVESKITKALDYMSTVMNYMKGEIADAQEEMMEEKKLTKSQQEERDQLTKTIKKSTKPQYGEEEGTDAAFGIATNIVKSRAKKRKKKRTKIKEQGI